MRPVSCYGQSPYSTKIMDFRGFDSSRILILRGGIPRPKGNFPESLSQAILVGIMLVGRLGVLHSLEELQLGVLRAGHRWSLIYFDISIDRCPHTSADLSRRGGRPACCCCICCCCICCICICCASAGYCRLRVCC